MKAKIQLYTNDGLSQNGYPVKLIVSHSRKTKRKTIHYSDVLHWDQNAQMPLPSHPDFENLYMMILEIKRKMTSLKFMQLENLAKAIEFLLDHKERKKTDFYDFWQKRIDYMFQNNRNGNAIVYRDTMIDVKKYFASLEFEDITIEMLTKYKEIKRTSGLKNTSIKKNLVTIRAVYNQAVKMNFCDDKRPFLGLFDDIPVIKRRAKNFYLSADECARLKNTLLEHKSYQRAIDLSLLQLYLCGADLVDVYYLKKKDVQNNRVFLKRRKLGAKSYEYDVKLLPEAIEIFNKYEGDDEYMLPWRKSYDAYKTFRDNHTRDLKIVQKKLDINLLPKQGNLTTKVMRHTFATLAKFQHIEVDLIRELMGHERNEIDTIYKDKYPELERDSAQMKILKF